MTAEDANIPIILVGNKCDEDNLREVTTEYAKELLSKSLKNCGFMETSAKNNLNVREAFQVSVAFDQGPKVYSQCSHA